MKFKYLDYFHQLVDSRAAWEQRRAGEQLGEDTAEGPHVDGRGVLSGAEYQLGRSVEPRADVGHVGLALHEGLRRAEVAQLQDVSNRID